MLGATPGLRHRCCSGGTDGRRGEGEHNVLKVTAAVQPYGLGVGMLRDPRMRVVATDQTPRHGARQPHPGESACAPVWPFRRERLRPGHSSRLSHQSLIPSENRRRTLQACCHSANTWRRSGRSSRKHRTDARNACKLATTGCIFGYACSAGTWAVVTIHPTDTPRSTFTRPFIPSCAALNLVKIGASASSTRSRSSRRRDQNDDHTQGAYPGCGTMVGLRPGARIHGIAL